MLPAEFQLRLEELRNIRIGEDFDDAFYRIYLEVEKDQREQMRTELAIGRLKLIERYREPEELPRSEVQSIEQLKRKAIFFLLDEREGDMREDLWSLAWMYHTATLLGQDPRRFLREMKTYASEHMAGVIDNLVDRPDLENTLGHWMFHIVQGASGAYVDVDDRATVATVQKGQVKTPGWKRHVLAWLFGERANRS